MMEIKCLFCNLPVQLPEVVNIRFTKHAVVHIDCNKAKKKEGLDKKQFSTVRYK